MDKANNNSKEKELGAVVKPPADVHMLTMGVIAPIIIGTVLFGLRYPESWWMGLAGFCVTAIFYVRLTIKSKKKSVSTVKVAF